MRTEANKIMISEEEDRDLQAFLNGLYYLSAEAEKTGHLNISKFIEEACTKISYDISGAMDEEMFLTSDLINAFSFLTTFATIEDQKLKDKIFDLISQLEE